MQKVKSFLKTVLYIVVVTALSVITVYNGYTVLKQDFLISQD